MITLPASFEVSELCFRVTLFTIYDQNDSMEDPGSAQLKNTTHSKHQEEEKLLKKTPHNCKYTIADKLALSSLTEVVDLLQITYK